MTTEEKAKAYDEALEKIQPLYEQAKKDDNPIWSTYEYLFPKLRESEDERIRKFLIDLLSCGIWKEEWPFTPPECVEYLEKQKEQKPAEIDEYEIIKKHITEDVVSGEVNKRLKECGWYITYEKPTKCSEDFTENIRTLLNGKLTRHGEDGSMQSTVFIDDKTLKDIVSGIWFYVGKEALKYPNKEFNVVEWSEEDDALLKEIVSFFKDGTVKLQHDLNLYAGFLQNKFKSLRPLPKQEWSEEDEENFKWFDKLFRAESIVAGGRDIPQDKYLWFKSFRNRPKATDNWKPSEEQMEWLESAVKLSTDKPHIHGIIISLYEQLKRLPEK